MRLLKKHSGAGQSPLSHVMLASAAAGAALVAFLGSPLAALAEEAADQAQETPSAFDILIPKPAEFIPALIAFLVIWVALAKFVWPSVLKTLDKRQQTIQDNLDAAEENKLQTARAYEKHRVRLRTRRPKQKTSSMRPAAMRRRPAKPSLRRQTPTPSASTIRPSKTSRPRKTQR